MVKRYAELLSKAAAELVEREFGPEGLPSGVKFSELEQLIEMYWQHVPIFSKEPDHLLPGLK